MIIFLPVIPGSLWVDVVHFTSSYKLLFQCVIVVQNHCIRMLLISSMADVSAAVGWTVRFSGMLER